KPGTFTGGRREFDVAAVGPRQRARDGQAEAGAAPAGPVPRAVRPVEAVEDAGRLLLAHAGALVGDVEDRAAVHRADADADRRAGPVVAPGRDRWRARRSWRASPARVRRSIGAGSSAAPGAWSSRASSSRSSVRAVRRAASRSMRCIVASTSAGPVSAPIRY